MKKKIADTKTVASIYSRVREILETARSSAYRAVNFAMVQAYWHIGSVIVEEEQQGKKKADYGTKLINELSLKLSKDFGSGFSAQSLWNMRQFYLYFPILSALRRELSWTHYKILLRVDKQ
ncbi:MAG: DUF1016 domain-containing protein, partial [Nitrospirae bacterium]|nr:DUF1016 domain-containing protein [Nitrospirota bacterium]